MQSAERNLEPHRGPADRRGKPLAPIQTTFVGKRISKAQRSPPTEKVGAEHSQKPAPVYFPPPPTDVQPSKQAASKGSFFGLFGRSKSKKQAKLEGEKKTASRINGTPITSTRNSLSQNTRSGHTSVAEDSSRDSRPSICQSVDSRDTSGNRRGKPESASHVPLKIWSLPPLFQAYPQAVKHAILAAPLSDAETILKSTGATVPEGDKAGDESRKKHRRRLSGSTMEPGWTNKIFVLATSGFMLQYAGDGQFDRLPEKIMQLGKDSAAFASDAIPGKHWVLQISQAFDEDAAAAGGRSKSVFSRLSLWGDMRRSVTTFLLVMNSAEDMNSWLVAVRKEIEALGGKSYRPDVVRKSTDELASKVPEHSSRLSMVKREPFQFSKPQVNRVSVTEPPVQQLEELAPVPASDAPSGEPTKRQSLLQRRSGEIPSNALTLETKDQAVAKLLPTDHRFSSESISAGTFLSSPGTSPSTSPTGTSFGSISMSSDKMVTLRAKVTPQIIPLVVPRSSEKTESMTSRLSQSSPRPLSTYGVAFGPTATASPTTPNFSVPTFSKRFSQSVPATSIPRSSVSTDTVVITPPSSRGMDEPGRRDSILGDLPNPTRFSPKGSRTRIMTEAATLPLSSVTANDRNLEHAMKSFSEHPIPRASMALVYRQDLPARNPPQRLPPNPPSTSTEPRFEFPTRIPLRQMSPHPPPTIALPNIPTAETPHPNSPSIEAMLPSLVGPNKLQKLRRPASMQVRSEAANPRLRPMSSQPRFYSNTDSSSSSVGLATRPRASLLGPPVGPPPRDPLPDVPVVTVGDINFDMVSNRWPRNARRSFQDVRSA